MSKVSDPDIQVAIEKIDHKISKLKHIRDSLEQEYSVSDSPPASKGRPKKENTRKQEIVNFLLHNGPMKSIDIQMQLSIPRGTVSNALNDKKTFRSLKKTKRWDVVQDLKKDSSNPLG